MTGREEANAIVHAAGGYGPPGGGGGGYGGPPPGGYGGPPQGPPPGGFGGGGFGSPPQGGGYGGGGFGGGGFGGGGGGGFGPPGGGFAPPGGPMGPGMGDDINTTLPMVLSIVAMVLCCGGFPLSTGLGIAGLVMSIQSGNAKKTGDIETARAKAKTALILAIVGMALGFVGGGVWGVVNSMSH